MTEQRTTHALMELLRLIQATPSDAPLRQAYAAGRIRQELPSDLLLEAVGPYLMRLLADAETGNGLDREPDAA